MSRMDPNAGGLNERQSATLVAGGSSAQLILGAAAAVLAIILLAGFFGPTGTRWLLELAVICASVALLVEGALVTGRLNFLLGQVPAQPEETTSMVSGLNAEFIAGCAGIVLGILGILGIYPLIMAASALILLGGALCIGNVFRSLSHPAVVPTATSPSDLPYNQTFSYSQFARESAATNAGAMLFSGLAVIAIGIIALYGIAPLTMVLCGLLGLGGVLLLRGASVGSIAAGMLARQKKPESRRLRPAA